MDARDGMTVWLGRRWPEALPLAAGAPGGDWRSHYAAHRSFPTPVASAAIAGRGVAIVDVADFTAVQAAHGLKGDWLILAAVPDLGAQGGDYEVRLQTEALVYGGLRDLELTAVARDADVRAVFVVDTPGRQSTPVDLQVMALAAWQLREAWDVSRPSAAWPPVCRSLRLYRGTTDAAPGDASPDWRRLVTPAGGEPLPEGARLAVMAGRAPAAGMPLLFQCGDCWLAIGRPIALSAFPVTRLCYEAAALLLHLPEPAWPEPGRPEANGARRFLLARRRNRPDVGVETYIDSLLKGTHPDGVDLPSETPAYVQRWLGMNAPAGGS